MMMTTTTMTTILIWIENGAAEAPVVRRDALVSFTALYRIFHTMRAPYVG